MIPLLQGVSSLCPLHLLGNLLALLFWHLLGHLPWDILALFLGNLFTSLLGNLLGYLLWHLLTLLLGFLVALFLGHLFANWGRGTI